MYNIEELVKETEKKMDQALEAMIHDFTTYRTGRANPVVLQKVLVDQYGYDVPIQQVATISVPDPRQLMITPFDRNMLSAIEKAIQKSDLNLTPNNDGTNIRLIFLKLIQLFFSCLFIQLHKALNFGFRPLPVLSRKSVYRKIAYS